MGEPRALIIAPTRELVVQIAKDAEALTRYSGLSVMSFVGGMEYDKQLKALEKRHCDILVATPGRLLDFQQRGEVHLDMVEVMVLDEADRMLDMGFIPQVRQIIRQTPPKSERQTLLFSATFTDDVMNLAKQWTTDPAIVEIGRASGKGKSVDLGDPAIVEIEPENVASETVEQHVYAVAGSDKYKLLYNLVTQNGWQRVMVFANRKDEVRRIEERLVPGGHRCGRTRHSHRRHQPCDQLHPAGRPGRLRAPHRPHRACGHQRSVDQLRRGGRRLPTAGDRGTAGAQDQMRDAAGRVAHAGAAQGPGERQPVGVDARGYCQRSTASWSLWRPSTQRGPSWVVSFFQKGARVLR